MNLYKKISIKILTLVGLLFLLNFIYRHTFWKEDINKYSDFHLNFTNIEKNSDVLYFGESSNKAYSLNDNDTTNISGFIQQYFTGLRIGAITKEASHAGIYYELTDNIPEDAPVKTIVITLNMRSFDAGWIFSKLEIPLRKGLIMIKKRPALLNRFLLSLNEPDNKTESQIDAQVKNSWRKSILHFPYPFKYKNVNEWDNAMANGGWKNTDGSWNMPKIELACHYIKTYAFQIDTLTNPRIRDFDNIVKLAKRRGYNLVFNLLPENLEKANDLVGNDLIFLMKQNRDILLKRYNKNNVRVVDNLEIVPNDQYIDSTWTTEHYKEAGRKLIAKNVAQSLKSIYPKNFKTNDEQFRFFNNFEDASLCSNSSTLTAEKAFSGKVSAKTDSVHAFSPAFERYIFEIPKDKQRKVSVVFWGFLTGKSKDIQLVFSVENSEKKGHWEGFSIEKQITQLNTWQKVSLSFRLPENSVLTDKIKVYLWNPTKYPAFIDDFEIIFSGE
jgi:hypothetical protein